MTKEFQNVADEQGRARVISIRGAEEVKLTSRISRKMRYGTQSIWVSYLNKPMRSNTGWRVYWAWRRGMQDRKHDQRNSSRGP